MTVQIIPFESRFKSELLTLFDLNCPAFFAPEERSDFLEYLGEKVEDYFVVFYQNKLVACGGINYPDGLARAVLSWDIIHPDFHKKGIGTNLVQYRIRHIQTKGVFQIGVRTSQMVYSFYEKNGFQLKQIQKEYWAIGYDLYDMVYVGF